jgi:hypothetical protein
VSRISKLKSKSRTARPASYPSDAVDHGGWGGGRSLGQTWSLLVTSDGGVPLASTVTRLCRAPPPGPPLASPTVGVVLPSVSGAALHDPVYGPTKQPITLRNQTNWALARPAQVFRRSVRPISLQAGEERRRVRRQRCHLRTPCADRKSLIGIGCPVADNGVLALRGTQRGSCAVAFLSLLLARSQARLGPAPTSLTHVSPCASLGPSSVPGT